MNNRIVIAFSLCATLFCGMCARLIYLSYNDSLATVAKQQTSYTLTVSKSRANIYDCDMRKLVNRDSELTACVLPTIENLSKLKGVADISNLSSTTPFITKLDEEIVDDNISVFETPKRYRDEQLACHIIGYTNSEGSGVSGIERAFDSFLTENGVTQSITYSVNGLGESLGGIAPKKSKTGNEQAGVVLTIDSEIQSIIEAIGQQYIQKGAILVISPNGDIKGLASFPSYSQNNLEKSVSDTKNSPMINRVLSAYAVGSSFKISTAVCAIESGINEIWYRCNGAIDVNGQKFSCHNRKAHSILTMKKAMGQSCNTYFIKLGLMLDKVILRNTASDLSFGKSFLLADGIESDSGTLPTLENLDNTAEVANFSFGQGKLTATPLQISLMMSCIVNGGEMPYPRLVIGTTQDKQTIDEQPKKATMRVMSKSTSDTLLEYLTYDVMETENQYALPISTTAGGKTATAQTGRYDNGVEQLNAWFSGFFPAKNPEYIVTVLCENGVLGNLSASPVFQKIADQIATVKELNGNVAN